MKSIQQIYCTHCTYGSSAIESRQGELADRTLGYSARAGSLPAEELRRFYRYVERDLYYHLPDDTPPKQKLELDADTAPSRMIFQPSSNGVQFLAHICYRQKDTAGRPGSYFGHALVGPVDDKKKDAAWSTLDCLRQWGAPQWVTADSSGQVSRLAEYDSIKKWTKSPAADSTEVFAQELPLIGQSSMLSLLGLEDEFGDLEEDSEDDGSLISSRFKAVDTAKRRELLTEALKRFLEIARQDKHSLLLVAEPGLATLLYYAILRLVPRQVLKQPIGFSTYEPSHNRVSTTLAATCFHDPARDIPPEVYRSGHAIVSTVAPFRTTPLHNTEARYADLIVERLYKGGWEAVDALHRDFVKSGASTLKHLEELAVAQKLVPQLLRPTSKQAAIPRDASDVTINYLRRAVVRELESDGDASIRPEDIQGTPRHLIILRLLAIEKAHKGAKATIKQLLKTLPDNEVAELVSYNDVAQPYKLARVQQYVQQRKSWPPKLPLKPMFPDMLKAQAIDEDGLNSLYKSIRSNRKTTLEFLGILAQTGQGYAAAGHVLRIAVKQASDSELIDWLSSPVGKHLTADRSPCRADVIGRLSGFVKTLATDSKRFAKTLAILEANKQSLNPESQARVFAWGAIHATLTDLGTAFGKAGGTKRGKSTPAIDAHLQKRVAALAGNAQTAEPLKNVMGNKIQRSDDAMRLILPMTESLLSSNNDFVDCWNYIQSTVLAEVIRQTRNSELAQHIASDDGRQMLDRYPKKEPFLQGKLNEMLKGLLDDPSTFSIQLRALVIARSKEHLPKGAMVEVDFWMKVDSELLSLNSFCKEHRTQIVTKKYDGVASEIHGHAALCAKVFVGVLPPSQLKDVRVKKLIVQMSGVKELADVAIFWQTFEKKLEEGRTVTIQTSSSVTSSSSRPPKNESKVNWGFWSGIVVMMAIGAGAVWKFMPTGESVAKPKPRGVIVAGDDNSQPDDGAGDTFNAEISALEKRWGLAGRKLTWENFVGENAKLSTIALKHLKGGPGTFISKQEDIDLNRKVMMDRIAKYYSPLLSPHSGEEKTASSFIRDILINDSGKTPDSFVRWAKVSVANLDLLVNYSKKHKEKFDRLRALMICQTQTGLEANLRELHRKDPAELKKFNDFKKKFPKMDQLAALDALDAAAMLLVKRHGFPGEDDRSSTLMELYKPTIKAVLLSKAKTKVAVKKDGAKKDGAKKDGAKKDGAKKDGKPINLKSAILVDRYLELPQVDDKASKRALVPTETLAKGFPPGAKCTLHLHGIEFSKQPAFKATRPAKAKYTSIQRSTDEKVKNQAVTYSLRAMSQGKFTDFAMASFVLEDTGLHFKWIEVKSDAIGDLEGAPSVAKERQEWLRDALLEVRCKLPDNKFKRKFFSLQPPVEIDDPIEFEDATGSLLRFIQGQLEATSPKEWDVVRPHLMQPHGLFVDYGKSEGKNAKIGGPHNFPLFFVTDVNDTMGQESVFKLRASLCNGKDTMNSRYDQTIAMRWDPIKTPSSVSLRVFADAAGGPLMNASQLATKWSKLDSDLFLASKFSKKSTATKKKGNVVSFSKFQEISKKRKIVPDEGIEEDAEKIVNVALQLMVQLKKELAPTAARLNLCGGKMSLSLVRIIHIPEKQHIKVPVVKIGVTLGARPSWLLEPQATPDDITTKKAKGPSKKPRKKDEPEKVEAGSKKSNE